MAEIATYRCNNGKCRLTVRVCKDFPVWKPDAPLSGRSLSPSPALLPYVERFRTELYCHHCRVHIADARNTICPRCKESDLRQDQTNQPCAQWAQGVFTLTELLVR